MELKIDFKTLNKGTKIILEPHDKEFLKVPIQRNIWKHILE